MPPLLTAETGVDALAHCIEGYVGVNEPYHPYYEALALYGVKLVGRSLRAAYKNGNDIEARMDMCMAATYGGISYSKGLSLGHAISNTLGGLYHIPHGRACAVGLLCFIRVNKEVCKKQFLDLVQVLDGSDDLNIAVSGLFKDINMRVRFRDIGVPENELRKLAFEVSLSLVTLAPNPVPVNEQQILELLREFW
jgi:alcohol dehydrogenase class IV